MREEQDGMSEAAAPGYVFDLLEGTWRGEGRGEFPTIRSFTYRETLIFERPDEATLFYIQRTERRPADGGPFANSHWESGFIHALATGEVEAANVQIGGRGEVLAGHIEQDGRLIRLVLRSTAETNDARMVATARLFEIDGDTLRYEMDMATTRVRELTRHVFATLRRVGG